MTHEKEQEIKKVQVHIDQAKEAVVMYEKLLVLESMPEYQELIIESYMVGEPARLAGIITDPSMLEEVDQREILSSIKAVGHLGDYLRNIYKRGVQMKTALEQAEEYQGQLRNPTENGE